MEHLVTFDHDLTDAERTTLALTLTSALAANNNKLQLGADVVNVSGKPDMFVAGEKGNADLILTTHTIIITQMPSLCKPSEFIVSRFFTELLFVYAFPFNISKREH